MKTIVCLIYLLVVLGPNAIAQTSETGYIKIQRGSLEEIVQDIRLKCGLKIARISSSADATSMTPIKDIVASLLSIPENERTPVERARLIYFQGLIPSEATKLIPYPEKHDFSMPSTLNMLDNPDKVIDVLKRLTTTFASYSYEISNSLILIYPKDDVVTKTRVNFHVTNLSITDAILELNKLLQQNKIGIVNPQLINSSKPITLNVDNVPISELLCRFSECLGPTFTFGMGGSPPETGWRYMRFLSIFPPDEHGVQNLGQ